MLLLQGSIIAATVMLKFQCRVFTCEVARYFGKQLKNMDMLQTIAIIDKSIVTKDCIAKTLNKNHIILFCA